ncbi:MAG: hypothetical protein J6Z27_04015 [Bacteroidales bacterium]|nr:hypothetical protein [Bacteroidales bacterium]
MKVESFFSFITGALVGAAAIAVYLSSEDSESARKCIRDVKAKAKETFDSYRDDVNEATSKVVDNVSEAVHTASDAVESAIDSIKKKK